MSTSLKPPYIASPLQAHVPIELEGLYQRSRVRMTDADKQLGANLLTETYCDLIDACFTHLLDEINKTHASKVLIEAVEEAIVPLATHPKDLMKFNFIINKTLDGVIALIRTLFKRMLRKLAPHLPRELYPTVAAHLETFLIV